MSFSTCSAGALPGPDFCFIFAPCGYDEPEILPSESPSICLMRADGEQQGITLSTQIASIDTNRRTSNLSSAIRLYVLEHFRMRATSTLFIGERQTPSAHHASLG